MSLAEKIIYETEQDTLAAIEAGADVNEHDKYGFRPLIEAVICKRLITLKALLVAGADIEQGDIIKRTALQWASDRNEPEFCKVLLQAGANPNHYSADGQPILVNPILRQQLELVELFKHYKADYKFAQDYISAKLLGHRFELTGETDIVNTNGTFIPVSFEGFNLEFTSDLISRSLDNYINSIPGQKFSGYNGRVQTVMQALKNAAHLTEFSRHKDKTPFKPLIESFLMNDLLLLPCAYKGHAITFIKYGNLWAKCDRGVGAIANTVTVSEIHNPYILNNELYEKILYEHKTEDFIQHELPELLKLKIITTLPTRHQISGNCSWANVETSIPTMLYLLSYNPRMHDSIKALTDLQKEIYQFYKAWIDWDKDSALDEALDDFASADKVRKLSKAMILGSILVQRCDPKFKTNVERARKILSILVKPEYNFILESYIKSFNPKTLSGARFHRLLQVCNLNVRDMVLKKKVQYIKGNTQTENLVRMTTALHVASLNGDLSALERLILEMQMDVNYIDRTGSTALMYAAYRGHLQVVEFLVQHGANISIKNLKGGTAIRYAAHAGHRNIVNFLTKINKD